MPIVASNCRGNRDLVENNKNGFIIELNNSNDFCEKIIQIRKQPGKFDNISIQDRFLLCEITKKMKEIYFETKNKKQ